MPAEDPLAGTTPAPSTPETPAAPKFPAIRGRWTCNHGAKWNITQTNDKLGGTVTYPGGKGSASISGKISGQSITLGWRDKDNSGAITLSFSGNKPQAMSGSWTYKQKQGQDPIPADPETLTRAN